MATKKMERTAPTKYEVVFVQCELDKNTKGTVRNWDTDLAATTGGFDRLLVDGYKISFSPDRYHDCVGVFATMPDKDHKHHGLCLTARGPNALMALKVLVYKHFTILGEDWGTPVAQEKHRDEWG